MLACHLGRLVIASSLLMSMDPHTGRRVVDPNAARPACGNRQPVGGFTALIDAVREGYISVCALLLYHGADINQADRSERTPLWHAQFMAIKYQHDGMVNFLLEKGASLIPTGGRHLSSILDEDISGNLEVAYSHSL